MQALFVSLTGLLKWITRNPAEMHLLQNGLFYFGCAREAVFDFDPAMLDKHIWRIALVRRALLSAEAEGRVAWRTADGRCSFEQLNELLQHNNLQPLTVSRHLKYSAPEVELQATQQALPLHVIWHQ